MLLIWLRIFDNITPSLLHAFACCLFTHFLIDYSKPLPLFSQIVFFFSNYPWWLSLQGLKCTNISLKPTKISKFNTNEVTHRVFAFLSFLFSSFFSLWQTLQLWSWQWPADCVSFMHTMFITGSFKTRSLKFVLPPKTIKICLYINLWHSKPEVKNCFSTKNTFVYVLLLAHSIMFMCMCVVMNWEFT